MKQEFGTQRMDCNSEFKDWLPKSTIDAEMQKGLQEGNDIYTTTKARKKNESGISSESIEIVASVAVILQEAWKRGTLSLWNRNRGKLNKIKNLTKLVLSFPLLLYFLYFFLF